MSVTTTTHPSERLARTTPSSSLRRTTAIVGVAAAAITTAAAAALHAAGVSFEIDGEMIPLLGFAQMTFIGVVIGALILAGLNRWSGCARNRFVQVAVALTALSCVPSIVMPDDIGSQIALVTLHIVPAAIIVPVLARHART